MVQAETVQAEMVQAEMVQAETVQTEMVQAETVQTETHLVSSSTALEAGVVLETRRGEAAGREFDLFLVRANVEVVPVDAEQAEVARSAWRKYGKGRLPAALNFEHGFACARAKSRSAEPLPAKEGEFALTDVAIPSL